MIPVPPALRSAYKSWLVWFNFTMALVVWGLPLLQELLPSLQVLMSPAHYKWWVAVIAAGNVVLHLKDTPTPTDR